MGFWCAGDDSVFVCEGKSTVRHADLPFPTGGLCLCKYKGTKSIISIKPKSQLQRTGQDKVREKKRDTAQTRILKPSIFKSQASCIISAPCSLRHCALLTPDQCCSPIVSLLPQGKLEASAPRRIFLFLEQWDIRIITFPHPAWPLVDGALFVSKRRSPAPDDLLTFVCPLCRPVGDPKPRGLQGSTGFVVGVVRSLSQV